jgi:hypothetical protein
MPVPDSRRRLCLQASLLALAPLATRASRALEAPGGSVVLTISGDLGQPNHGAQAVFDMPMLERLPQRELTTRTPWYSDARKFTGPLLREVLGAAGARGTTLRALALNDYKVAIPFVDITRYDVLLARLMNDQPMPVRDKGPLFIIYPFDSHDELRNTIYYSRCAWQLKAIEVV